MAIIAFLYAAALVLLLTGLVVWATSKAQRVSLDALESTVPTRTTPEESAEVPPASILEQLERQYRNSPSYNADP
ncbi:hypothetical protein [Thermostichus vulcanus]|uniref:Uncharacterized protein n=1 Tax=Thermostichus vulcanus str. 'Rupite' TaxID=2813851 RepID=A0ABT0C7W3_THEVL|nr:hypothetical protein [Thermostichus vulcanus]MCJ2541865.1 hypothetical protein [Thermostichus vulcanus str. 'Rupite']